MGDANVSSIPVLPSPSNVGVAKTPEETNEWPQKLTDRNRPDREATYAAYLRSNVWREKRKAAIERAGGQCQLCSRANGLHVHHRTYERIGQEAPEDLTVLCKGCHRIFHEQGRKPKTTRSQGPKKAKRPCSNCGQIKTTKGVCGPCRKYGGPLGKPTKRGRKVDGKVNRTRWQVPRRAVLFALEVPCPICRAGKEIPCYGLNGSHVDRIYRAKRKRKLSRA